MKLISTITLLFVMTILTACDSSDSGNQVGGMSGLAPKEACMDAWSKLVAAHVPGRMTEHGIDLHQGLAGGKKTLLSRITRKEEVITSDFAQIEKEVTTTPIHPSGDVEIKTVIYTAAEYQSLCEQAVALGAGTPSLPDDVSISATILEQRDEMAYVTAGAFDTHYTKTEAIVTVYGQDVPSIVEHWDSKDYAGLNVRMSQETTFDMGGQTYIQYVDKELLDFIW